jgi:hypothetical protein
MEYSFEGKMESKESCMDKIKIKNIIFILITLIMSVVSILVIFLNIDAISF